MIRLEKFTEEDFDRLINWIKNEDDLILFAGPTFSFPLTKEQLSAYINSDVRKVYRVIDTESGEVVGHCELNDINTVTRSARICRMIVGDTSKRNKGYGRKMIQELKKIAFSDLSLNNLTLKVYEMNEPAIKCYRNCGFEIKGKIHKSLVSKGRYWPSYIMSLSNRD